MPQPEDLDPTPATDPPGMERRAFVRRMTTDAVGVAGRVFGLSKALTRGAVAAGLAVRENLDAVATEQGVVAPIEAAANSAEPDVPDAVEDEPTALTLEAPAPMTAREPEPDARPAPPAPPPPASPSPPRVTDAQAAILAAATTAILAVNGHDNPPIALPVAIHWDGETIRFGSLGWSRRSAAIQMDPRVTLYVEDPDSDVFLAVEGRAEFVLGSAARDAMAPLLSGSGDPAEIERNWADLVASDPDRVVVVVRPSKVLPGRRT